MEEGDGAFGVVVNIAAFKMPKILNHMLSGCAVIVEEGKKKNMKTTYDHTRKPVCIRDTSLTASVLWLLQS